MTGTLDAVPSGPRNSISPRTNGLSPNRPNCARNRSTVNGCLSAVSRGCALATETVRPSVSATVTRKRWPTFASTRTEIGTRRTIKSRANVCSSRRRTAGSAVFQTMLPTATAGKLTSPSPKINSTRRRDLDCGSRRWPSGCARTSNTRPPCSHCSGWPWSKTTPVAVLDGRWIGRIGCINFHNHTGRGVAGHSPDANAAALGKAAVDQFLVVDAGEKPVRETARETLGQIGLLLGCGSERLAGQCRIESGTIG